VRIDLDLVDRLLTVHKRPEDILGDEMHDASGDNSRNSRHGISEKTMKGDFGELPIEVPRDRNSEFEPEIVP